MKNSTSIFIKSIFSACQKIDYAICLHRAGQDNDDTWIHPDRPSGHYLAGCDNARAEKLRAHLWAKNQSENGSIYFRPAEGSPLILLDDLNECDSLKIAQRYSSLIINTSPGKYQAWIIVDQGLSFDERHLIQVAIIGKLNNGSQTRADAGASNGNQLGRVPGFHNRKPVYAENPPAVRIIGEPFKSSRKLNATEYLNNPSPRPAGGAVPLLQNAARDKNKSDSGHSEREFGFAINSLRRGKSPEFIMNNLIRRNENMGRRQGHDAERYARLTIYNAARELGVEVSI